MSKQLINRGVVANNKATNHKRESTQSDKRHLWKIEGIDKE